MNETNKIIIKKRCAIYTRKSNEEGLEQEFNSLDSQREAGEAYVLSQKHDGWVLMPDRYDDGGYSGGNTERPALKRLFADIENGLINIVVVYKIDRLSRSLVDFVKMVEFFDKHNVSFVSVTQSFNTQNSMGRLMLNVLLSFAQFEREVTAERIRDKVAASKKKGMWMGGPVPLGYDVKNRKLIINIEEAEIVQKIFNRYLQTSSVITILRELNKAGYTTKSYVSQSNKFHKGKEFSKNTVWKILNNPVYTGKISHKGEIYEGEHQAIIDEKTWNLAQNQAQGKIANKQRTSIKTQNTTLLKGLMFDVEGFAISPTYSKKKGKIYRYYVSQKAVKKGFDKCQIKNIPAEEIESIVLYQVRQILTSTKMMMKVYGNIIKEYPQLSQDEFKNLIENFDGIWDELFPAEQQKILQLLINKITVYTDKVEIEFLPLGIIDFANRVGGGVQISKETNNIYEPYKLTIPVNFVHGKGQKFLITPSGQEYQAPSKPAYDNSMIKAICRAFEWQAQINKGKYRTAKEIAEAEGLSRSYVSDVLRLNLLSPEIINAIITGKQPRSLTLLSLMNKFPLSWEEQKVYFELN
ncbi:MAG: recombinase family protein, partial [Rickettsiales bacterium]|nr:recombinase family protein [Rickettsiales bacterium]